MRAILGISCLIYACAAHSMQLPLLPSQQANSPHRLFISSERNHEDLESWNIDGGYAYNIFSDIDVYVGARINHSYNNSYNHSHNHLYNSGENGFLSGVSYQVTQKVSVRSILHSYVTYNDSNDRINKVSAEISSRLELSEVIDLHATLDYQEWQQGVEVGLGFRF